MATNDQKPPIEEGSQPLYFFPDRSVSANELERILADGTREERVWAISNMLRYAQWDDIWLYVSRDEVREIFPALDLSDKLRQVLARHLKVETPVA
ncbi:MAG: hypothetical protein GWP16_03165 [Nitrospirae bacterium]|nr:hypothetical protein [Nitrospirota bacterium]